MTWTYEGLPDIHRRDAIRLLIGDTDTNDQLLSDEELRYATNRHGQDYRAAAEACGLIAGKFGRLIDRSVGDLSASFSQKRSNYLELQANFLRKQALTPVGPLATGFRPEDFEPNDAFEPFHTRVGMHDNYRTGNEYDEQRARHTE